MQRGRGSLSRRSICSPPVSLTAVASRTPSSVATLHHPGPVKNRRGPRDAPLEFRGGLVARLDDGLLHVYDGEHDKAEQEERREGEDRDPVAPCELQRQAEEERTEPARPPLTH